MSELSLNAGHESALSIMNSSRFSAIDCDRDVYAEDIVM